MIEQQGRILELQAHRAKVLLGSTSGCPACDEGKGCGAGVFGKLINRKNQTLEVDNPFHAGPLQLQPGQAVIVGIPESFFLRLILRLYLLPLLAALCGAGLGHYLGYRFSLVGFSQDLLALFGALFLAGLTLLIIWKGKTQHAGESQVQLLRHPDLQAGQQCQAGIDS